MTNVKKKFYKNIIICVFCGQKRFFKIPTAPDSINMFFPPTRYR